MSCLNDIPWGWTCSASCTAIFGFSFPQLQSSYLARTSTRASWVKPSWISACKMLPLNHISVSVVLGNLTRFFFTCTQPVRTYCYIMMTIFYFWCLSALGFGQLVSPIASLFGLYCCLRSWERDTGSWTWTSLFQCLEEL